MPKSRNTPFFKHFKMAQLAWRFHWFKKRLERDPDARNYTDVALTPDSETDTEMLEMLGQHLAPATEPIAIGKIAVRSNTVHLRGFRGN